MRRWLVALAAFGAVAGLVAASASGGSAPAHRPIYMPDAQNIGVGYTDGIATPSTVPGGLNSITGNDGKQYPVQSLWSNDSAEGACYCAGAGDDLPLTG